MDMQILTVSSKGQISIPVELRKRLSIESGTRLVAYASGDVIMLKVVKLPTIEDFDAALSEAQNLAAASGLNEDDVNTIIKSHRQRRRMSK
jgi:AbrB family looped-hinge helix DNA binding protein